VPSEVDVDLQRKVAQLFSNSAVVNERLPSFTRIAHTMRERWVSGAAASGAAAGAAAGQQRADDDGLDVFLELSEYVLRADLEVLYGRAFTEAHAPRLVRKFGEWVQNIANGQLVGFFDDLGELLREAIAERRAEPERYADERSVLQVYLESGALERHDDDAVVGLLSMTLMAAVFNTQVSLAWILVHLYSDPELLERARAEVAACPDLGDYSKLQELPFLNSCIDEAVRLHTMLPGNTVLRKTRHEIQLGETTVPEGAVLWLYPNAVHLDETCAHCASSRALGRAVRSVQTAHTWRCRSACSGAHSGWLLLRTTRRERTLHAHLRAIACMRAWCLRARRRLPAADELLSDAPAQWEPGADGRRL
jgi:cytochrome P450